MRLVLVSDRFIPKRPWELLWLFQGHQPVFGSVKLAPIKYEKSFVPRHIKSERRFWKSKRYVACEVRVNLNYSAETHFTLFYWFKSHTWQCKINSCMCQSHEEAWETTNMLVNLAMEKSAFKTTFTRTIKLCNLLLKWLLGSNLSHLAFDNPNM